MLGTICVGDHVTLGLHREHRVTLVVPKPQAERMAWMNRATRPLDVSPPFRYITLWRYRY